MTTWQISSDTAHLVSGFLDCWSCKRPTQVVCIYCEEAVLEDGPDEGLAITYIQDATPNVLQMLAAEGVRLSDSKTAGSYYANRCTHCDALQGDHFLHHPGSPFFPENGELPDDMIFEPIEGPVGLNASWSSGALERLFEQWSDE